VTVLTDLSDPERPRLLAVKPGRDEAAGLACLDPFPAPLFPRQAGRFVVSDVNTLAVVPGPEPIVAQALGNPTVAAPELVPWSTA
jgi:hypothetical protein